MKYIKVPVVLLILLIISVGCSVNIDMNKKEEDPVIHEGTRDNVENSDESKQADEVIEEFGIGETIEYDGMEITLKSVRTESGGGFHTPSNDKFIVADVAIENNSEEERIVSTFFNIDLEDDSGYKYKSMIALDGVEENIDGSMTTGENLRGEIPFDVSESDFYQLTYIDPFKTGKAVWTIQADSID